MLYYSKIILLLIITFLGLFNFLNEAKANNNEVSFIVTAYYSPLPNQEHYTTGTYAGDVKLNGEGRTTASGKGVFIGVLAAPIKYPFGTKIYFEGFGVGSVEDRGGSIVKAGVEGRNHDRIDVWMGYGDEGLQRALKWGKKTIKGNIVSLSSEVTLDLGKNINNKLNINNVSKEVMIIINYPNIKLNGDYPEEKEIKKVQDLFKKLGLYNGKIDGNFTNIRRILLDFQKETGIIKTDTSRGAGYFGEQTKSALISYFENKTTEKVEIKSEKDKITIDDISYKTLDEIGKKLQEYPEKEVLVVKLTKAKKLIKIQSQKDKIEYLLNLLI